MRKFIFGVASVLRSRASVGAVRSLYRSSVVGRRYGYLFDPNTLRKFSNFRPGGEMRVRKAGLYGAMMDLDLNDHIQYWAYMDGAFDPTPPALACYFCKGNDGVYLDVGANVGTTSLPAAVQGVRTFAVEPSPTILARLFRNMALNHVPSMSVACMGAGDSDGENISFYIPQGGNFGAASVFKTWNADKLPPKEERAYVYKLDTICAFYGLDKIAVIKLDIEGYELAAIQGAQSIIERDRPAIIFEWRPDVAHSSDIPDLSSLPDALPKDYVFFSVIANRDGRFSDTMVELSFEPFVEAQWAENVIGLVPGNAKHDELIAIAQRGERLKVEAS